MKKTVTSEPGVYNCIELYKLLQYSVDFRYINLFSPIKKYTLNNSGYNLYVVVYEFMNNDTIIFHFINIIVM